MLLRLRKGETRGAVSARRPRPLSRTSSYVRKGSADQEPKLTAGHSLKRLGAQPLKHPTPHACQGDLDESDLATCLLNQLYMRSYIPSSSSTATLVPMSVPMDACRALALLRSAGMSTVAKVVPSPAAYPPEAHKCSKLSAIERSSFNAGAMLAPSEGQRCQKLSKEEAPYQAQPQMAWRRLCKEVWDSPCTRNGSESLSVPRGILGRSTAGCLSRWRAVKLSIRESSCTRNITSRFAQLAAMGS